jgi:hypothetical protein
LTLDFVKFGVHVGAEVGESGIHVGSKIGESGIHVGSKIDKLTLDFLELADDFAKVGVDLDSHVVEILFSRRFVHGVTVVVSHGRTDWHESEIVGGIHRKDLSG